MAGERGLAALERYQVSVLIGNPSRLYVLPREVGPGTDAHDAAICSIMVLGAETGGRIPGVPELVGPGKVDERLNFNCLTCCRVEYHPDDLPIRIL